jgi:N-acetylglutamate synthase-like GNAT family acetyltransferase
MTAVTYRSILPEDYEAVRQFLAGLGWDRRVRDPQRFAKMMDRADRTVLALDEGRVVGCARALCDGVSNGYISMLAVAADRRGLGIGREIVKRLMAEDEDGSVTWVLRAGHDSRAFWEKMGFVDSEIAMERTRGK